MKIIDEYRAYLAQAKANVVPFISPARQALGTYEPYWVALWNDIRDTRRRANGLYKKYKTVRAVVNACDLRYIELNEYQRRVKNPRTGKFIDWWKGKNQRMLDASGNYTYYSSEKSIVKQILRII